MQQKRKRYIIIGSILLVLIIARLVLPYFVLQYANRSLAKMDGYYGHVDDIDISLYRGAYQLNDIYINRVDSASGKQVEFFKCQKVDLSIEWQPLFQGSLVGNMEFDAPKLVFTKEKAEIGDVAKDTGEFRQIKKDLMPLKINRFEINNGSIHYIDSTKNPKVDLFLTDAHVLGRNLKNTTDSRELLPSDITATAKAYEGTMSFFIKLNAFARTPTFDLTAEIRHGNLVQMNDFFKAYGGFDVSRGTIGLYTEFAAADGKIKGYIKPIIKDLKVKGPEDKEDSYLQKLKEDLIGLMGKALTNISKRQVGTKIPIEGDLKDPSVGGWEALKQILKNAFIQALLPVIDNEIDIQSVEDEKAGKKKSIFKRIFGRRDKE